MKHDTLKDELKNAPMLSRLHGVNPYHVPEHYFETSAAGIEEKLNRKPTVVKRFSISRTAARLAAAASIALFLGTAGWFYFHNQGNGQQDIYLTPEQISQSVYFDDLDLTLLKEEAAHVSETTADNEIENYLLEDDLTFLSE